MRITNASITFQIKTFAIDTKYTPKIYFFSDMFSFQVIVQANCLFYVCLSMAVWCFVIAVFSATQPLLFCHDTRDE